MSIKFCFNKVMLLIAILTLPLFSDAQTMLARLKYEEAEKAFNNGQYSNCIALVEETEKILKSTSPKTMFLKIQAGSKMEIKDFKTLSKLRDNCRFFLDKYSEAEDIEERYREVYDISKSLNKYPNTENEWLVEQKRKEEAKAAELERQRVLNEKQRQLDAYPLGDFGFNLGTLEKDVPYRYINWTGLTIKSENNIWKYWTPSNKRKKNEVEVCMIGVDRYRVTDIQKSFVLHGDRDEVSIFESQVSKMTSIFGLDNLIKSDENLIVDKKPVYKKIIKLNDSYPIRLSLVLYIENPGAKNEKVSVWEYRQTKTYEPRLK